MGWMEKAAQDIYTHQDLNHLEAWAEIVDTIWKP
jgi:hypothetical protein